MMLMTLVLSIGDDDIDGRYRYVIDGQQYALQSQ